MSTITTLRAALLANTDLVEIIGTKVRADQADDKDSFPYIVFRRTDVKREYGLNNTLLSREDVYEIECWHEQRLQADTMADMVTTALLTAGIVPDNNDPDALDPELVKRCAVVTCTVWATVTVPD